jgi:hypothetical protein
MIPLSFEQRLLHDQASHSRAESYSIVYGYRLEGKFDPKIYESAVELVVDRYEALRTVFVTIGHETFQSIQPINDRHKACLRLQDVEFFSLGALAVTKENGPTFAAGYREIGTGFEVFHAWHHAIVDAWSVASVTNLISKTYNSLKVGEYPVLPESLSPLLVAQQELQKVEEMKDPGRYWADKIDGATLARFVRANGQTPSGKASHIIRSLSFTESDLKYWNQIKRISPFVLFLAASGLICAQSTQDICIPTIINTRDRHDLKDFIGLRMRVVLTKLSFAENETVDEYLVQVRKELLKTWQHRHESIGIAIERFPKFIANIGNMPLPFMIQMLDLPERKFSLIDVITEKIHHGFRANSRFVVEIQIIPTSTGFDFVCVYDLSVVNPELLSQKLDKLLCTIRSIMNDQSQRIPMLWKHIDH